MALPGTGFKLAYQVALEMSFTLLEPYVATTSTTSVNSPGSTTVTVNSFGIPIPAIYAGAELVIDPNTPNQEVVVVTAINLSTRQFTALFAFTHSIGATIIAPTFPTQATSGDPFFTQSEILSYLGRAQNEFLAECPCIFALTNQLVNIGQIYQQLVCDSIEIDRIAASNIAIPVVSMTRTSNLVTAISATPHNLSANSRFSIFNAPDPGFNGAFKAITILSPTSWTYAQYAPNAYMPGGMLGLWTRLYETSQEQLTMQDYGWRNQNITKLASWYEDRTSVYKFGVNGRPATAIPVEILSSIRDTHTLALTDGFLVPDICLHGVKYKALEYCFSKDGEMKDPMRESYCKMRADRIIMATKRYMEWMGINDEMMEMAGK
jgi:hypothetical protein